MFKQIVTSRFTVLFIYHVLLLSIAAWHFQWLSFNAWLDGEDGKSERQIVARENTSSEGFALSQKHEPSPLQPTFMAKRRAEPGAMAEPARGYAPHHDLTRYPRVNVVATGYYAGVESTGKHPGHPQYGITYSGVKVRRDLYSTIAADPNIFPLGTILYIPGYGYGIVADTGSAIKGHKIDLYFETIEDVYEQWGKKQLDVYVIKWGDGRVSEAVFQQLNDRKVARVDGGLSPRTERN